MKNKLTKAICLLGVLALTLSIGIAPYRTDEPGPYVYNAEVNINL